MLASQMRCNLRDDASITIYGRQFDSVVGSPRRTHLHKQALLFAVEGNLHSSSSLFLVGPPAFAWVSGWYLHPLHGRSQLEPFPHHASDVSDHVTEPVP